MFDIIVLEKLINIDSRVQSFHDEFKIAINSKIVVPEKLLKVRFR